MWTTVIGSVIGRLRRTTFHAKGVFMIFAGLLGLALGVFMIWWGRPINGVMSPRVQRFELLYGTTICVVFAAALAMLVAG
jgi:hypothetical protein